MLAVERAGIACWSGALIARRRRASPRSACAGARASAGPTSRVAMRPGPSDHALETPLLLKLQGWGVVLVAFFVLWIPCMWLSEPRRTCSRSRSSKTEAIARGQLATQLFSEDNSLGVGCVRCHGTELRGGVINALDANGNPILRLSAEPDDGVRRPEHRRTPNIFTIDDIFQVIQEGRDAMPSWSIRYSGALDDQQINDLVQYLVHISSQNVPFDQNVCLNKAASDKALAENAKSASPLDPRDP